MPKENNDKFTPDEDGEHKAYYGWFVIKYKVNTWSEWDDRAQDPPTAGLEGTIGHWIKTPYFKHKLNCEDYTGTLCHANGIKYRYERNVRASHGKWTHANGDEIDESKVPVGERFEKI